MLKLGKVRKAIQRSAENAKRPGEELPDTRAQKVIRVINGQVFESMELPLTNEEVTSNLDRIIKSKNAVKSSVENDGPEGSSELHDESFYTKLGDYSSNMGAVQDEEPQPVC